MSAENPEIILITGLGNPGEKYKYTRHNAGFLAIDKILEELPTTFKQNDKFSSIYWEGRIKGKPLLLQKPMTFMNESGRAVKALATFKNLLPHQVMLIYDDMDLTLGTIRLRKKGSSGGHNGVESVIRALGTVHIPRLRIGIGKQTHSSNITNEDAADLTDTLYDNRKEYVLSAFTDSEFKILEKVLEDVKEAVKLVLFRDFNTGMNIYNKKSKEV